MRCPPRIAPLVAASGSGLCPWHDVVLLSVSGLEQAQHGVAHVTDDHPHLVNALERDTFQPGVRGADSGPKNSLK